MVAVSEVEGSETGSGRQKSVEKRNWFRLPGKYRKAELVPVAGKIEKSGTGSGCQEIKIYGSCLHEFQLKV